MAETDTRERPGSVANRKPSKAKRAAQTLSTGVLIATMHWFVGLFDHGHFQWQIPPLMLQEVWIPVLVYPFILIWDIWISYLQTKAGVTDELA